MTPLRHQIANSLANERLHLIIMPTESCNLRCTYCYEEFKLKRMEPSVVDGVKNLLSTRAPQLQLLEIAWFGENLCWPRTSSKLFHDTYGLSEIDTRSSSTARR